MERRRKLAALQMTQGHRLGKPYKATRLPTHLSHGKKNRCCYHLEGHEGTKTNQGATPQQPIHNSKNLESRRGIIHICLSGQAWPTLPLMRYDITAHALLSGDGEKMKIGHPKNDPRPSFGQTRKHNSITNPPFTWKKTHHWYHLEEDEGTKMSKGATPQQPLHNSKNLESRRGIVHICLPG